MSLKIVHIVFISASILLAIGFGGWCLKSYFAGTGSILDLVLGLGSFGLAISLVFYGKYFLKKLKDIGGL